MSSELRKRIPQRLFEALNRNDVSLFLRFWSALPAAGRPFHPLSTFVWAALSELGERRMTGAQLFATDQRLARRLRLTSSQGQP
jgi:hypothetical protein